MEDLALVGGAHPIAYYNYVIGPRGYHHDGVTYLAYQAGGADRYLDPLVVAYDHDEGTLTGPVRVGSNPLSAVDDSHGNPALIVDDSGYVHVIYGGHGSYRGEQRHAVSTRPGSIESWNHLDAVPAETTYPQLITLDDGRIVLFQRGPGANHGADWTYQISSDDGRTFSEPTRLLAGWMDGGGVVPDGPYGRQYGDSWYLNVQRCRDAAPAPIAITAVYHACGGPTDAWDGSSVATDAEHLSRYNQYYLEVGSDMTVTGADGTDLSNRLPLTKSEMDDHALIHDSGVTTCQNAAFVDYAPDGTPHCYFGLGVPGDGRAARYAVRSATAWSVLDAPVYQLGDSINHYQAVTATESESAVRLWAGHEVHRTTDGGRSWTSRRIAEKPIGLPTRIPVPNAHPNARFVGAEGAHDGRDESDVGIYLYGDTGFVTPE